MLIYTSITNFFRKKDYMRKITVFLLLITLVSLQIFSQEVTMKITSSAFNNGAAIPSIYSCKGDDISPPLHWEGEPEGTVSFALICDDPDAPMGTGVHCVYYNIPSSIHDLPQAFETGREPSAGGVQGMTSFRRTGYGGPCPPSGTHRYFFKIYALDSTVNLKKNTGKTELVKAMKEHILAEAELMGTFAH